MVSPDEAGFAAEEVRVTLRVGARLAELAIDTPPSFERTAASVGI